MTSTEEAIQPHELEELFAPFASATQAACALAVSGGCDSTALMVLFADWLRQTGRDVARHTVLTVDHGLRPESAAEARAVTAQAAALGFQPVVLVWEEPKPRAGIQAAAREARYRLMVDYMRANTIRSLFSAHTRDDQAETLLMRLARGSGVDGLAAMAPCAPASGPDARAAGEGRTLHLQRPFLGVAKARLLATLRSRGIGWIEDPSNQMPVFERSRLRAARVQLRALGLTDGMLALSAQRLLRARAALEGMTDRFCDPASGNVSLDPCGCITIDQEKLRAAGEEIALRVAGRAVAAAGGAGQPVPLAKLEAIVAMLVRRAPADPFASTLARAMVSVSDGKVVFEREPGRLPPPRLSVPPGGSVLWDGRFIVSVASDFGARAVEVRPLGKGCLARLRRADPVAAAAPVRAAASVPSIWLDDMLVAVPPLQHWAASDSRERLRAHFVGFGASAPS